MTDFEQVFQENQAFIYKYLYTLCREGNLAEELTQETFFKAYMNLSTVRREEKIPVWLCQIAKNTYFAWYRQQKKQEPLDAAEALPGGIEPEKAYLQKELTQEALQVLENLEDPYKKVLILSIFGGLSLKEISEMFGKSESWARVTFHRGKQKLLERIR